MTKILLGASHGIYIPKLWATQIWEPGNWEGVAEPDDIEILSAGPEHEWYWEVWDSILQHASYIDSNGERWLLHQDGDLFAYKESESKEFWEASEET